MTPLRFALFVAYASTVLVANWLVSEFGLIGAGFGLLAPAGTYAAGLALGLRDELQEVAGPRWVLAGIGVGAALSAVVSPALALASGAAFLLSELADFAVYTPLRTRSWWGAVMVSNLIGGVIDTFVFLNLAGFPLTNAPGQILVKTAWCTVPLLVVRAMRNRGGHVEAV